MKKKWNDNKLKLENLSITITNRHFYNPNNWVMHVNELNMNTVSLNLPSETPIHIAQVAAINKVKEKLNAMMDSLNSIE